MRAFAIVLALSIGCMGAIHVRGTPSRVDGVGVSAEGPVSKLRFGLEGNYERTTGESRRGVFGYDATLRIGLVSLLREHRCPACVDMPWVDLGPGVGLGAAMTGSADLIGHAFASGWLDVRLSRASSHPVLRLQVERDAYSGQLTGGTQFVVGFGYVTE